MSDTPGWEVRYAEHQENPLTADVTRVVFWNRRLNLSIKALIEGSWEDTEAADLTENGIENVRKINP